jgi:hypothetical protein
MRCCSLYRCLLASALLLPSCGGGGESDVPTVTRPAGAAPAPAPSAAPAKAAPIAAPGAAAVKEGGSLIVHELTEESFIESPSRRDPFRSFLIPLTKQEAAAAPQISSLLDQYQLDELKLVAIVSGSGPQAGAPMAMVEDPSGVGHIVHRGNYVGKGETVRRVTTGEEIQIFWKVARIREDAIVFEREDPFSATEATVTKILTLEPQT